MIDVWLLFVPLLPPRLDHCDSNKSLLLIVLIVEEQDENFLKVSIIVMILILDLTVYLII